MRYLNQLRQEILDPTLIPEQQRAVLLPILDNLEEVTTQLQQVLDDTNLAENSLHGSYTQLLQNDIQFAKIFHLAPLPISISSVDEGRIHDVNEAFLQSTGYVREEVVSHTSDELGLYANPTTRKQLIEQLKRSEHHSVKSSEIAYVTKQGEVRYALGCFELLNLNDENYILSMFNDITERKRSEEEWHKAVQAVMQDTTWFSHALLEKLAAIRSGRPNQAEIAELRQRERQVLTRVAQGMTNEAIAAELGITTQTVRNYVSTIYEKLGVRSRAEAVVWARERGLVRDWQT